MTTIEIQIIRIHGVKATLWWRVPDGFDMTPEKSDAVAMALAREISWCPNTDWEGLRREYNDAENADDFSHPPEETAYGRMMGRLAIMACMAATGERYPPMPGVPGVWETLDPVVAVEHDVESMT